ELINEEGLASYGEDEVRKNIEMGAVEVLLLSEDLKSRREIYECPVCSCVQENTIKEADESDEIQCPECGEKMKESKARDIIDDFVDMAEEVGSEVEIISTETEEGMQLMKAFGGIAAILRYRV
ncbi:MAG: peptide chain release factor aRF-1, partial [Methanobacterium sp.]